MPGLVGLITKSMVPHAAEEELSRMVRKTMHDPAYLSGTWVDRELGLYLGWTARPDSPPTRLLNPEGSGDVALVLCGEVFGEAHRNAESLRREYQSDKVFPAGLNGRFHGLVADRKRGSASLFVDRYGMRRLYYHEAQDAFYFAAEAKAILEVCPALRVVDLRGFGELVACGCVLENRTLFKDVQVLPPGSLWSFREGRCSGKEFYFDSNSWEDQTPLDGEAYYRELKRSFCETLPAYLSGGQPVAMSLTGGLDSRMIMAWSRLAPGELPCYSFGGSLRECQDVQLARKVAAACGQPHEVIPVGEEFLNAFPRYAERSIYLTDACTNVAHATDLFLNERAKAIAPVRMTGNYGGEVLRGVRAFRPRLPEAGVFDPEIHRYVHNAAETYGGHANAHPVSFAVFRQAPWHHYGLLALEESQLSLRSPFLDNDLVKTAYRAPLSLARSPEPCLRLIADGDNTLSNIRTDRGVGGNRPWVIRKLDRALLEFTFKAEWAYGDGMPQWLCRADRLFSFVRAERLFLGRHKFTHFRTWYRGPLSRYVRDTLLARRSLDRSYVVRSAVEQVVNAHVNGRRNHISTIEKLLTLELIHRLFFDAS